VEKLVRVVLRGKNVVQQYGVKTLNGVIIIIIIIIINIIINEYDLGGVS